MASIELQSSSGKWKHRTTVDDPVFAPILGSMVESGLDLPDTLIIPGVLGEELERHWKKIEDIHKWMQWEKRCTEVTVNDTEEYYTTSQVYAFMIGLPPPTVWRHEIRVLSIALNLPIGWEAYTAVDERTPLEERLEHMEASRLFLRAHPEYEERGIQDVGDDTSAKNLITTVSQPVVARKGDDINSRLPSLAAFARNVWLINRGSSSSPIITDVWHPVRFFTFLDQLDWEGIVTYLQPYSYLGTVETIYDLALVMTGQRDEAHFRMYYSVQLAWTTEGIGFTEHRADLEIDKPTNEMREVWRNPGDMLTGEDNLANIYSRLLSYMPDDTTITRMGLEPILGDYAEVLRPSATYRRFANDMDEEDVYEAYERHGESYEEEFTQIEVYSTRISDIVAWVHATTLKYLAYIDTIPSLTPILSTNKYDVRLMKKDFPSIIQLLGNTLGLYAMRRILLSLLYYVESTKGTSEEGVEVRVDRALYFSQLLEEYLEEHEGEDEGVKTLALGRTT